MPSVHGRAVTEVNVHEAKTHLSRLLARVEAGEEILISRAGQPVARLVPARRARGRRRPGRFAGKGRIKRCAFLTADAQILDSDVETVWGGRQGPPRPRPRRRG